MESETAIRIKVLVDFEERDNFSLAREVEVGLTDEALLAIAEGIKAAQSRAELGGNARGAGTDFSYILSQQIRDK